MGKYAPLTRFLREREENSVTLSFGQIEEILGFSLPGSAYKYPSWWANSASGQSQIRGWKDAGWETRGVDLGGRRVTFVRVRGEPVARPAPKAMSARTLPAEGTTRRTPAGVSSSAKSIRGGASTLEEDVLAQGVDVAKLPPQARRLLESRARARGRKARAEIAAILNAALEEERRRLAAVLAEMRERTQRPGAFDLLVVLGRKRP